MSTLLPRFYPVLPDAAWVTRAAAAGAKLIQLRWKGDTSAIGLEINAALAACRMHGAALVVNDHWREAIAAGAPWVHLGQEDLAAADRAAIADAGLKLGISTHDDAELATALAAHPDYIALGPIYETTLKAMPFGPQGLERIGAWRVAAGGVPLVAIGGITLERAAGVFDAGADSIAVVSDITQAHDPEAQIAAWLALG